MKHFPTTLATTSEAKQREWLQISKNLGQPLEFTLAPRKVELLELQDTDPVLVAVVKAIDGWKQFGLPVLVEDVSFACTALKGGFPGALYKPTENARGVEGILALLKGMEDRSATVTTTIAFLASNLKTVYVVRADIHGVVPHEVRGTNGFGFDPIFIPTCETVTYAQMTPDHKNRVSMRRRGIEMLLNGEWTAHQVADSPLGRYLVS